MYIGNWIFIILVLISFVGLYKIFQKTGRAAWKAFVPFLNFYEWIKLLERPWWWVFLMIVPGVNILMYSVLTVITAQYFGKRKRMDLTIAAFFSYLYLLPLGFSDDKFVGIEDIKNRKGGFIKTWLDPLVFAIIAASVIRTFFLEAFTIPTSSLEKSLMVGDFLFVNKFAYGAKTPQTPLSFPFAHHTIPIINKKSYLEWIKLPYYRLPGYSTIKNGDIVVFNYPDGDSVALNYQNFSYYQLVREIAREQKNAYAGDSAMLASISEASLLSSSRDYVWSNPKQFGEVVARPKDKREHYVKRCVAIAGDKLEIKDGELFINDTKQAFPEKVQHHYYLKTKGYLFGNQVLVNKEPVLSNGKILDKYDIYVTEGNIAAENGDTIVYELNMPRDVSEKIKENPEVISVTRKIEGKDLRDERIFPHNRNYKWNNDNFGPFTLPKAGATVKIDTASVALYKKIMNTYDDGNHMVEIKGDKVFYDGTPITSYTFKQDYYWMMGDNRHNSADSRSWGVVPFDHVVGKPVFVWFSMKDPKNNPVSGNGLLSSLFKNSKEGKFRWERFFTFVGDKGLSSSYFIHFLVIVAGWWGIAKYLKKRKAKKEASK
jgi:signal peptidase I